MGRVAVVAMPDERLGEKACCFVVLAEGSAPLSLEEVTAYLLEHGLARVKMPERIEVVDALPTTATGKIQKNVLRDRIAATLLAESAG